jgi:SAM-dependent methyltransferase
MATEFIFDLPHARRFVEARQIFLRPALKEIQAKLNLRSAADVGCGVGYFSGFLNELGFRVTGLDGRLGNVDEARRRHPGIEFAQANVEDSSITQHGTHDFVLCVGLLYHLENPLQALRNLASITKDVLLIESYATPHRETVFYLREESSQNNDQSLTSLALYPSESSVIKICYKIGFRSVYRFSPLPDHEDFRTSKKRGQQRTMLLATKCSLELPYLTLVAEPKDYSDPWQTTLGALLSLPSRLVNRIRAKRSGQNLASRTVG